MRNSLLDIAETYMRKEFRNNDIAFSDLVKFLKSQDSTALGSSPEMASEFLTDLIQDPRFVNIGKNNWRLREFVNLEDYKKNKTSIFGLQHLLEIEAKEHKGKEVEVIEEDLIEELNAIPTSDIDEN